MIREPSFKMGILALKGHAKWWFFALCPCHCKFGARANRKSFKRHRYPALEGKKHRASDAFLLSSPSKLGIAW